jgi:hypothetical protein
MHVSASHAHVSASGAHVDASHARVSASCGIRRRSVRTRRRSVRVPSTFPELTSAQRGGRVGALGDCVALTRGHVNVPYTYVDAARDRVAPA